MQQKFARFWASPGTIGGMSRILPPSLAPSTLSPGNMRSSTRVQSVSKPSTASKPSSPPAQSLPSRTLTSPSGYTPMPQLQASELSSLKCKKARSASFVVPRAPLIRLRKHTPPLNWSASPSSGPSPSSVPTWCRCHLKCIRTIMLYNGLRPCARDLPSFIAGQPPWRNTTSPWNTAPGNLRLMWMGSAACPSTPRTLKMPSCKFGCWRTRRKSERSPTNYILLPTSVATLCGNSSVTDIPIKQGAPSVWRPPRTAHSANRAPIMAITRRQRALFSLRDHGIPSPLILWAPNLQIDAKSYRSSSWTASPNTPSSSPLVTTPRAQSVRPSCGMSSPTLAPPEDFSPIGAESSSAPFGQSFYVLSWFSKSSLHPTTPRATQSTRGATARWTTCSVPAC